MNAGANVQETAGAVESIEVITTKGEYKTIKRRDLNFSYRSSPFQDMNDLAAITAVTFRLKRAAEEEVKQPAKDNLFQSIKNRTVVPLKGWRLREEKVLMERRCSDRNPMKQSKEVDESIMLQMLTLLQLTVELYQELHTLDMIEQEYQRKLLNLKFNPAQKGDNSVMSLNIWLWK
ncbi:UDP-n-acetylenolpyruvoylglucosamine reductase [Phtheirospermum japonicum]|uniref:UDP-n-acetylenolpyruvoylglucosamine reductase n=1 Tax=Phtheirospermum japonicum TaxID=374723 RepID=A0A830CA66_9LAMI|nr:UDP-n-acetylenolpyruvoylglucosamine reductase [Phtheirospermum japonicum]